MDTTTDHTRRKIWISFSFYQSLSFFRSRFSLGLPREDPGFFFLRACLQIPFWRWSGPLAWAWHVCFSVIDFNKFLNAGLSRWYVYGSGKGETPWKRSLWNAIGERVREERGERKRKKRAEELELNGTSVEDFNRPQQTDRETALHANTLAEVWLEQHLSNTVFHKKKGVILQSCEIL